MLKPNINPKIETIVGKKYRWYSRGKEYGDFVQVIVVDYDNCAAWVFVKDLRSNQIWRCLRDELFPLEKNDA